MESIVQCHIYTRLALPFTTFIGNLNSPVLFQEDVTQLEELTVSYNGWEIENMPNHPVLWLRFCVCTSSSECDCRTLLAPKLPQFISVLTFMCKHHINVSFDSSSSYQPLLTTFKTGSSSSRRSHLFSSGNALPVVLLNSIVTTVHSMQIHVSSHVKCAFLAFGIYPNICH